MTLNDFKMMLIIKYLIMYLIYKTTLNLNVYRCINIYLKLNYINSSTK